jgi:hypothetical protein
MNERIKELAEQAGYMEDMFGVGHWDMPECKKFAQLIVSECISKIETEASQYHEPVWAFELVNDIKEHFSIET